MAMNAKHRVLPASFLLACALFIAPSAHAVVITASDYAVGTNLTNGIPGVTLEYASRLPGQGGLEFNTSPILVGTYIPEGQFNPPIKTLGSYTTGGDYGTDLLGPNEEWDALEVSFTVPIETVTVDSYTDLDFGIPTWVFAYSANGTFLGVGLPSSSTPCIDPPGDCRGIDSVTTFNSTTPIGFVLATSDDAPAYVTGIDIPGIPEPPSLALMFGGALAIGILALHRRRH